jgi:hypothetical protein
MTKTLFDLQNTLQKTIDQIREIAIISEAESACDHLEDRLCEFSLWADSKLSAARDNIRIRKDVRQARLAVKRSCQGCGWPIDSTVLQWYCRICDPSGKREEIRAEAELFEAAGI